MNPHGPISRYMQVRSYPIVEKHGLIWIWMGDQDRADERLIPDMSYAADGNGSRTVHSYLRTNYRYDILIDNLMDLSHGEYLHVGSLSGGVSDRTEYSLTENNDEVLFVHKTYGTPPTPVVPWSGGLQDITTSIHWHPGQVIKFVATFAATNDPATEPVMLRFAHLATPETEGSTHYFMSVTRFWDLDNPEADDAMKNAQLSAIEVEDGQMLLAVDEEMGGCDLMDMRPLVLPSDAGALRVRRVMKRLLAQEGSDIPTAYALEGRQGPVDA